MHRLLLLAALLHLSANCAFLRAAAPQLLDLVGRVLAAEVPELFTPPPKPRPLYQPPQFSLLPLDR